MPQFNDSHFPPLPTRRNSCKDQKNANGIAQEEARSNLEAFATIIDLPDELLVNILDYLPGIHDWDNLDPGRDFTKHKAASLLSLSRTNRCFHRLVAEKLYRTFDSYWCEPYLFLRTITSNAHLAKLVQTASFHGGPDNRKRHTASAQDKKIIKEGLKSLGTPGWKTWATDCNDDHAEVESLFLAILAQTPNISVISSSAGTLQYIGFLKRANRRFSLGSMHQFRNLRKLSIAANGLDISQLAPIFRTPSLRDLKLDRLVAYDFGSATGRADLSLPHLMPARCNNLEELYLTYSFVHPDVLGVMVAASRSLRIFHYEMELDTFEVGHEPELYSTKIDSILRCQISSLESLSLATNLGFGDSLRDPLTLREGLRDFTTLTYFRCPIGTIVDREHASSDRLADKLPQGLETLRITLCYENDTVDFDAIPALEHMADTYAYDPPAHLKELKIMVFGSWHATYDWARITEPLSQTGINVVIDEEEGDDEGGVWADYPSENDEGSPSFSDDTTSTNSSDEVSLYSHSEEGA